MDLNRWASQNTRMRGVIGTPEGHVRLLGLRRVSAGHWPVGSSIIPPNLRAAEGEEPDSCF
jgi:hypothetical protein